MGFSTSGATAILLVGLLVGFGTFYQSAETSQERYADAADSRSERALALYNTDLAVTDVTYNATSDVLNVTAENTGSTTLSVPDTDLLVDGSFAEPNASVAGDGGRTLWVPGETLALEVTGVSTRPDRVKLVTEHGHAVTETEV